MGIPDKLFIITDNLITYAIAEISSIPLMVYSSRICPKNMEGILFYPRYDVCYYNFCFKYWEYDWVFSRGIYSIAIINNLIKSDI